MDAGELAVVNAVEEFLVDIVVEDVVMPVVGVGDDRGRDSHVWWKTCHVCFSVVGENEGVARMGAAVGLLLLDVVFAVGGGMRRQDAGLHTVCAIVPAEGDGGFAGKSEGGVVVEADGNALA